MNTKIHIEEIFSIYLNGGLVKSLEGNRGYFDSPERLLSLGYEKFGTEEEHSLFEKYYPIGTNKGFTFKVYFYKNKPWMSALSFFRFRLNFILSLAGYNFKKIDVFFDEAGFESGALIINDLCICRFEIINKKYPRILTLETSVADKFIGPRRATEIDIISNQLLRIGPDSELRHHKNVDVLFETIEKHSVGK